MTAKRLFDLFFVILGLIVLSPLLIFIAIWVKLDSRGTIFFLQTRVGQHGKLFKIIKFRTMSMNNDGLKLTIGEDRRITRSGYFLRKYKLDELPQLFNVLKGDMSLVGPRPEVPEYVAYYPDEIKDMVLSVPVGITDNASIEFRDESELLATSQQPETDYIQKILPIKLAYHQQYVNERTLWLDVGLIFKTLAKVFIR
ncbi:sugar transferase [Candidatus Albibeggiatoa sp. nov. NOAA]|uniref:sugar transferase n=1 Tax=Candidatus Albibeggiatoa sp. nov. NOAA TaxID=3162724 RepID=UPI0032F48A63|nr:sugar transferase [Thiotrichaceae bacterium]